MRGIRQVHGPILRGQGPAQNTHCKCAERVCNHNCIVTQKSEPASSPQSLAVKRAEVEFHNFASLGEPERALTVYAEENQRRGALIRNHLAFIGPMSPFLE